MRCPEIHSLRVRHGLFKAELSREEISFSGHVQKLIARGRSNRRRKYCVLLLGALIRQGKRNVCVQIDCDIDFSGEAIQPCKTQVTRWSKLFG